MHTEHPAPGDLTKMRRELPSTGEEEEEEEEEEERGPRPPRDR